MPKASKWTDSRDQQDDVEQRYRSGQTVRRIAREYSCRTDLISDLLRRRGHRVARGRERITADRKEALLARYAEGASIRALAQEFEMGEAGVSALLARSGAKGSKGARWTPERLAELRRLHDSGLSIEEIGRQLNLSRSALAPALRRAGVPPQQHRSRENHPNWKGGRVILNGYVYVRPTAKELSLARPNASGYVAEHRLVMAKKLKRPLLSTETVHHINGDRADNRLKNLQLRQGHHGTGVVMTCNSCGSHDISSRRIK